MFDFGAIRREETVGTTALCIACRVCVGAVEGGRDWELSSGLQSEEKRRASHSHDKVKEKANPGGPRAYLWKEYLGDSQVSTMSVGSRIAFSTTRGQELTYGCL